MTSPVLIICRWSLLEWSQDVRLKSFVSTMLKHSFHSAVRAASSGCSGERRGSCTRSVKAALAGLPSQRRTAVLDGESEKSGSQDESGRALAGEVLVWCRDVAAVGCILSASIDIWGYVLLPGIASRD